MQPDNHLIVMWAAKGGAGTTVVAAAAALHETNEVLLVDLGGDAAAVLGVREHAIGVRDWLASEAEPDRLIEFIDQVDSTTRLLEAGHADPDRGRYRPERLHALADWLRDRTGIVIVDAGTGSPPTELTAVADRTVLVTRADYLALTAAVRAGITPDEIFLVNEPGRALTTADIEAAIGAPVTNSVDIDPSIARAVDSGLFVGHASLNRAASRLTDPRHGTSGPEVDYGMQWTSEHNDHTFRLSYDPTSRELTFTDNVTNDRHLIGHYRTQAAVDTALDGWATHHADINAGLDWVQGQTAGLPASDGIVELMTPPSIDTDMPTMSIDFGI